MGRGGAFKSKNKAKIGGEGLKLKLLFLQGAPNFSFMSCACNCKNNSTCIVKQEIYSRFLMYLEIVKSIKKCHHILMLPVFLVLAKELCHKISITLVSITRPNSTKNITCSNIYTVSNHRQPKHSMFGLGLQRSFHGSEYTRIISVLSDAK